MKRKLQLAVLAVCTTTACEDPLLEVQTINGLRVVGTRVQNDTDPSDARLVAGSPTTLEWLVVSDRAEAYSAAMRLCSVADTNYGVPSCESAPFFEDTGRFDAGVPARFSFTPPELPRGSRWMSALVACAEGRARFATDASGRCSGGTTPREATFTGVIGEANSNPTLADDTLEFEGAPWQEADLLDTGASCRGAGLPTVRAGRVSEIAFELGGDDRESLPASETEQYGAEATESLLYSHFLSEPGLERPFSGISADSDDTAFEIELAPPTDPMPPTNGVATDFYLIVRDGRGGSDWVRRQVCTLP